VEHAVKITVLMAIIFIQTACSSLDKAAQINVKKVCGATPNCFEKVQDSIDSVPANSSKSYRIYISNGDYREKISLNKNNVYLVGQSREKTRLVFRDYAGIEISPGKNLTTAGSATLRIEAQDIRIENLTIENDFDFLSNDALASDNPKKINGSQAVALFIAAPSDRVLVRNVSVLGYQDTLFVNSGRSWFDKVLLAGNVDYIFGSGNALFTQSEVKTLARGKPVNPHGFITAPSTQTSSEYGLTFLNCRLTRDARVADNSVSLGRPWHPTTQFSDGRYADPMAIGKSIFINTWMDAHITTNGWYAMGGTTKEGGKKSFMPEDARFFEYKTKGPGAIINEKHRQLNAQEVAQFTRDNIFGDWRPQ